MSKLRFDVKFSDIVPVNPLFSKCKVKVMYVDDNRNNSSMSKESVMKALPTIYNIPIIGEFSESIDDFKGHGGKLEISDEGIKYIQTTKPYGIVPESSTLAWESIMDNGVMHEYLTCTGYLWTGRYPEALQVIEQGKGQSMEIDEVDGDYRDDGVFQIDSFVFSALCILGDGVEPCFESSSITGYALNKNEFIKEYNEMLYELKQYNMEEKEDNRMPEDVKVEEFNADLTAENEEVIEEKVEEEVVEESVETNNSPSEEQFEKEDEEVEPVQESEPKIESEPTPEVKTDAKDDVIYTLNAEIARLKGNYSLLEAEVIELREYKAENENIKSLKEKEDLFDEFAIGLTEDEMNSVREKINELSVGEIKSQLNEIFTQKNLNELKSKKFENNSSNSVNMDIPKKDTPKTRYAI